MLEVSMKFRLGNFPSIALTLLVGRTKPYPELEQPAHCRVKPGFLPNMNLPKAELNSKSLTKRRREVSYGCVFFVQEKVYQKKVFQLMRKTVKSVFWLSLWRSTRFTSKNVF